MIYLDYAATTPMSRSAVDAYTEAAEKFYGNSSSLHDVGTEAGRALKGGRWVIASILGVPERGVRFTGSGSEASFLGLVSLAQANRNKGMHLITTQTEHSSVSNTFSWLERRGYSVTRLPVNSCGQVELSEISQALRDDTILVSVQHVNSETGSVQPIRMIGKLLSGHQAVFHSDMVQSFCKIPVKPAEWGIQSLSVSAHKIHGPKGLGAAYLDPSVSWSPFIPGSVHENSFRPGTVDVPAVVSFAAAAREADSEKVAILDHVQGLKKTLLSELEKRCKRTVIIQGSPERSSPYITGLSIYGMEGQYVMLECSQRGLAMSTGSACQVNEQKPSPTLLAMGKSEQEARSFIRLSMDRQTTRSEIEEAVEILAGVVEKHLKTVRI